MLRREQVVVRMKWRGIETELGLDPVLDWIGPTDFRGVVAVVGGERRRDKSDDAIRATQRGFTLAARFLFGEKVLRMGPRRNRTLVMCLATALAVGSGRDSLPDLARRRLSAWYWRRLLTGPPLAESGIAAEAQALRRWLRAPDSAPPRSIAEMEWDPDDLVAARGHQSLWYFAVQALVLRTNPRDIRTGEPLEVVLRYEPSHAGGLDVHHLFPAAWCRRQGINERLWDSVVNKTPMTLNTNRGPLSDKAPSAYLTDLEREGITPARMNDLLEGHLIAWQAFRADDFNKFFETRKQRLAAAVNDALALPSTASAIGGAAAPCLLAKPPTAAL